MISEETLKNWFTYHPPVDDEQEGHYVMIAIAGSNFARMIMDETPHGADQTAAIRKVREAVMTANAAIACRDGNNG